MRSRLRMLGPLMLLIVAAAPVLATPARIISFQGALTDPSGVPKPDGPYAMTFRLYDVSTGGAAVWTESKNVTTTRGVFTTGLGDTTAFPSSLSFAEKDYWLSVQAGTDPESTPRLRLYGVPYALSLPGVTVATSGKVGILNYSPAYDLDVTGDINASANLREGGIALINRYAFTTGTNATGTWPINISGNAAGLSSILAIASGGTGISTAPTAAGQYLRSSGAGTWSVGTIPSGDLPSLSGLYVDLSTNQTAINGIKNFTNKVGIRNASPVYTLDVGGVIATSAGYIFGDGTIQLSAGWQTNGNGGTNPATNFLGTTDNKALEVRVNNTKAMRLEPTAGTPSMLGGSSGNVLGVGGGGPAQGAAVVAGGTAAKPNSVFDEFSVVVGGNMNVAGVNDGNTSNQSHAFVGGGENNQAVAGYATIAGGDSNLAAGLWASVGGGNHNQAIGQQSTIPGGDQNVAAGLQSAVGGGLANQASGQNSTIAGGSGNTASGNWSAVPGGMNNAATGTYAIASGYRAKANHTGSFVWADSVNSDWASTGPNQFLVRASGGVGINIVSPLAGVLLDVNGMIYSRAGGYMFPDGSIQTTAFVAGNSWLLNGNAGTNPGVNFVGTTDNQALEVKVNNTRVLRMEPTAGTPTIVGGYVNNTSGGTQGGFIGGGGMAGNTHQMSDHFGTIGGGMGNITGDGDADPTTARYATVGGGQNNLARVARSTVAGGYNNRALGPEGFVGGGSDNVAGGGANTTVAGGHENQAQTTAATVGGGWKNIAAGQWSVIAGGELNQSPGFYSAIGGGKENQTPGTYATVPGGAGNVARGDYSLAAGQQAQALHKGAFVWADSQPAPFASTNQDQFLVRAGRGVGINTNAPIAGVTLDVAGMIRSSAGGYMFPDGTIQTTAAFGGPVAPAWLLAGNLGTNPAVDYLGTGDANPLVIKVNATKALEILPTLGTPNLVGGDIGNTAALTQGSVIGGGGTAGANNVIYDNFGAIVGGDTNTTGTNDGNPTGDPYGFVGGGQGNLASGGWTAVAGGLKNIAGSMQSFVGGGAYNQAIGPASAIPGGNENFAPAPLSFIGGGQANQTPGPNATIGGGNGNVGAGPHSFIGGGQANVIQGASSVIGGGNGNQAMGLASTIPGGQMNLANGNYSFAAGQQAQATNHGSFVWADSQPFPFASAAVDDWSVRSVGGARFVSAINALGNPTAGVRLPPGGNAWLVLSDRNMKSNFETVDSKDVLERLVSIPIQKWNYNTQDPSIRHIGPMAQDLASAFAVGEDEKYINPSDADGVSMAAIQGLYQMVKERDQRIEQLEARLAAMEAKLNGK